MVPRLARPGRSFLRAGQYFLHDKGAATGHRVAFTHTLNMKTVDSGKALKVMAYTAMNQKKLKRKFYRAQNPDDPDCKRMNNAGRPTKTSVMHYSLSWHPSERPEPEHMIEAAKATLEQLELAEHECLMVAHNDEPQPHIHIIINKVHPETGRVAPLKYTKQRLSEWAKAYEVEHGKVWCKQRFRKEDIPEPDAEHMQGVVNAIAAALMAGDLARNVQPKQKPTRQKTEPEPRKNQKKTRLGRMFSLAKLETRPSAVHESQSRPPAYRQYVSGGSASVATGSTSGQGSCRRSADQCRQERHCPSGYDPRRRYMVHAP